MNMKKRLVAFVLFSLGALGIFSARAETYDYTAEWNVVGASAVGKSMAIVLPDESDEVYYSLSGLSSGGEYTFSASGSNTSVEVLYKYSVKDTYEDESGKKVTDVYIDASTLGYDDGEGVELKVPQARCVIEKQSWEDDILEDPTSETGAKVKPTGYFLHICGDAGSSVTVTSSKGVVLPERSGLLTVRTKGAPTATWSLKGQSAAYTNGQTVAIMGQQTVVFAKMTGLSKPADEKVAPREDGEEIEVTGTYGDTFDPKDDTVAGATKLTVSAKAGSAPRTLYADDPADHFAFSAKDGVYYDFKLADLVGDAELTLFRKGSENAPVTNGVTAIVALPLAKGDYILKVSHPADAASSPRQSSADATYTLAYVSANVGAIAFAKTAVTAKKSAGAVTLTVNRTSGEGRVRVLYGTVNGSAQPGVDYFAQTGELVWENGDKKAKTITVKLIPEAFAEASLSRRFLVQLRPAEGALEEGEYRATVTAGKDLATVTVTETAAKAPAVPQAATVKTEQVPLETGTYQGVVVADEGALENGFPALASVTFTAKDATKKALSAKVLVGGKTYAFAADTWSDESDLANAVAVMTLVQKVDKTTSYTNTLRLTVARGETSEEGAWRYASAAVELELNVPDATGRGYQTDVPYTGTLCRDNAKVQGYLDAVVDAVGYYTVALAPTDAFSGAPAGNGYLTLTVDNKGKAKVAGLLADGSTKPSYTSVVAIDGEEDAALYVPVYVAKSPYCFGGTLKLVKGEDGRYVVDSSAMLVWNNDNAALTYGGEEGWQTVLEPVGGYFNTVDNLQAHYLLCDLGVATADAGDLLEEALPSGYGYVADIGPSETPVALAGNVLSTEKRVLVTVDAASSQRQKSKLVDFASSVNPCNVQVKLTRATGLVTGSFSVWTASADGTAQKELTGLKHNGILILSRGESAALDAEVLSAGFFTQTATLTNTGKSRKYTASYPFNILAVEQEEPDWYAEDWGPRPE